MMSEAPISFCADRRTESDRSLREHHDGVADLDASRLRTTESCRGDVSQQHDLLVSHPIGNLCEVRLGIRHKKIFRLCAVHRISEAPPPDRFEARSMSTLRQLAGQTGATLSTRSNGSDQ